MNPDPDPQPGRDLFDFVGLENDRAVVGNLKKLSRWGIASSGTTIRHYKPDKKHTHTHS